MPRLIPFPSSRRVRLIGVAADGMFRRDGIAAEKYLQQRLAAHAETLRKKGITSTQITADVAGYEAAVRAALWRQLLGTGGAA